jgi:hypothetical protein
MGWRKGELIEQAFAEIGLAPDVFNVGPDEQERALRSLDSMMALWDSKGFRLGYNLPASAGDSRVDDASGLPDTVHEAVTLNLALRIAPGFGKMVSPDTRTLAKAAYDAMMIQFAFPPPVSARTLPVGAGNNPGRRHSRFFAPALDAIDAGTDADISL